MIEDRNKQDSLAVVFFAVSCLILYFNSLRGIFVFDDFHTIPDNLFIKSARYIPLFFKGYYTSETNIPTGMFRPLLMITFVFNYSFSRLQPLGYHIVNLLLHFLNVILLYSFLRSLKKDIPFGLALLAGILFLAHPLNTEAVTYITARSDLLVCFFVLSGFLCYIRRRKTFALILYMLGLLCKETALVFPFLIAGYDFLSCRINDGTDTKPPARSKYIFYIVFLAVSIIYWMYRQHLYGSSSAILSDLHRGVRGFYPNILTQLAVTVYYLRLFIWPQPLIMHHNFPIFNSLYQPLAMLSFLVIIAAVVLIFTLRKKHFLISLGLFWYLVCLLPKFYAPLNVVAAEHHFYLPSFGIYLILAVLLRGLYLRFYRKFLIVFLGIICIFSCLTWFRNYEYANEYVFWRKAVEEDPLSHVAHHNLGQVYVHKGLYENAEKEFKKTLLLSPSNAWRVRVSSWDNLSNVYRLQKRFKEALEVLNKVVDANLTNSGTYQNFGVIYLDMGDKEKAVKMWQDGLKLDPESSGILLNLGLHYLRNSEFSKAKEFFEKAVKYEPDSSIAYFGLGRIFEEEGKIDSAIKAFAESVSLSPNYADTHYYLGTLYAKKSDKRALNEFKAAIRLAPDFAEAHNNLAVLYASMQPAQMDLARAHAQKAIGLGYKVNEGFLEVIGLSSKGKDKRPRN